MLKLAPIALAIALLSGCASDNYRMYTETQKTIANANAMAEAARYQALAEIAKQGDTAAKVAAVMSLNQGATGGVRPQQQINPPEHWGDTALRWASLVLPITTQFYTVNRNSAVAMRQSDNATTLAITQSNNQANTAANTNAAFVSMNSAGLNTANSIAGLGFTATTGVANTGMSSIVNVANNGSNNLTTLGTAFSNATVNMTNAHSNAIINLSNIIPSLQPNIISTTTTNGCGSNTTGGTVTCP